MKEERKGGTRNNQKEMKNGKGKGRQEGNHILIEVKNEGRKIRKKQKK